jgi:hypothetical protein
VQPRAALARGGKVEQVIVIVGLVAVAVLAWLIFREAWRRRR